MIALCLRGVFYSICWCSRATNASSVLPTALLVLLKPEEVFYQLSENKQEPTKSPSVCRKVAKELQELKESYKEVHADTKSHQEERGDTRSYREGRSDTGAWSSPQAKLPTNELLGTSGREQDTLLLQIKTLWLRPTPLHQFTELTSPGLHCCCSFNGCMKFRD